MSGLCWKSVNEQIKQQLLIITVKLEKIQAHVESIKAKIYTYNKYIYMN